MSNFCRDCSIKHFGKDFEDLAGLSTPEDTATKRFAAVICEGCGPVWVNHEGVVVHREPDIERADTAEQEPTTYSTWNHGYMTRNLLAIAAICAIGVSVAVIFASIIRWMQR